MNTNGLAKLYEYLTPMERLPLILAASAREDEAERDRLVRSVPKLGFRLLDFYGLAEGLTEASRFHLLELVDLTAGHWQARCLLAEWEALSHEGEPSPPEWFYGIPAMIAYLMITKLDGWRRFCSEFNTDPELLMDGLPGYDTVKTAETAARNTAYTHDEVIDWMREGGKETVEVPTVESVAASLWVFVNSRAGRWG